MSVRNFLHGSGEIELKEGFTSARLVTEALKGSFRIRVLEESPSHIKCKIYRLVRFIGFPVLFPNPTLDIAWRRGAGGCVIDYYLTCYDYYVVAIGAFIFGISCSTLEYTLWASLKTGLLMAGISLLFFGGFVFIDTKYLVHRIRKALLRLAA